MIPTGWILITDALNGFGAAIAELAVERRRRVVLAGQDAAALDALAERLRKDHGGIAETVAGGADLPGLWAEAAADRHVNFLIHSSVADSDQGFADGQNHLDANCIGRNVTETTRLLQLAVGHMTELGGGRILTLAATPGAEATNRPVLQATLAYTLGLAQALRPGLAEHDITLTALSCDMAALRKMVVTNDDPAAARQMAEAGFFAANQGEAQAAFGAGASVLPAALAGMLGRLRGR